MALHPFFHVFVFSSCLFLTIFSFISDEKNLLVLSGVLLWGSWIMILEDYPTFPSEILFLIFPKKIIFFFKLFLNYIWYRNYRFLLANACEDGDCEMIQYLYEKGIDIHEKDRSGYSYYMRTCFRNRKKKAMKTLFEKGVPIDEKDEFDKTFLHRAARFSDKKFIKFLIKIVLKIEEKNKHGFTPLHCAAHNGNLKIVQYLIKKGAGMYDLTDWGNNIFNLACRAGHMKTAEYIGNRLIH